MKVIDNGDGTVTLSRDDLTEFYMAVAGVVPPVIELRIRGKVVVSLAMPLNPKRLDWLVQTIAMLSPELMADPLIPVKYADPNLPQEKLP